MIFLRNLLAVLGFGTRPLRSLAERQAAVGGIVCFVLGFIAYAFVRNSVYAELPELMFRQAGMLDSFFNLNLVQSILFLSFVYIPVAIVAANAISGEGIGLSFSREEYRMHLSALFPLWGVLFLIAAPLQWLVPHFLIIGPMEISIGIMVRSLLMLIYTYWAIKQLNFLSSMQAAAVFALTWLTFPVYYILTAFLFALPFVFLIPLVYWGSQWFQSHYASQTNERVLRQNLQALTSNPQDADAHYQLGLIHLKRRNLDAARGYFATAIKIAPQDPDYHYYLGRTYELEGDWVQALQRYEETYRLDPEYGLGDIFREVGKAYLNAGSVEKGMEFLKFFLDKRDSDPEARYWYAVAQQKSGDAGQMRFHLNRIVEQARSNPRFFRKQNREWIYRARNLMRETKREI